jgi:hypothetical protein
LGKVWYIHSCQWILSILIKEAKKQQYSKRISVSKTKVKTIWNIVKAETSKKTEKEGITLINYNGLPIDDQQAIANIFNSYFSSLADKIFATNTNERNIKSSSGDQVGNIFRNTRPHYPRTEFRYTWTQEIDKIIKSL